MIDPVEKDLAEYLRECDEQQLIEEYAERLDIGYEEAAERIRDERQAARLDRWIDEMEY